MRSTLDDDQRKRATEAMISLRHEFDHAIQTRVLALLQSKLSDERVHYYASDRPDHSAGDASTPSSI